MKNPIGISPSPASAPRFVGWLGTWWSRVVAGLAFALVATVTGVVSYAHIEDLTLALHQPLMVARLMPLGIDGLIVVGSVALLQAGDDHPYLGWLCVAPGAVASLFANVESGIRFGYLAAAWAGMASAGFFLATFTLERWLKAQAGERVARTVTVTVGCGHGVADDRDGRIRDAWFHSKDCLGGDPSYRGIGQMLGVHNEIVRQVVMAVADGGGEDEEPAAEPIRYASLNGSGS